MNEPNRESNLIETKKREVEQVLTQGQRLIDDENLMPNDTGFYSFDVKMGNENPDGEQFIQSCGFLSQFGVEGVYFPFEEEDTTDEWDIAKITEMPKSRRVSWNPTMLHEFLES